MISGHYSGFSTAPLLSAAKKRQSGGSLAFRESRRGLSNLERERARVRVSLAFTRSAHTCNMITPVLALRAHS